MYKYLQITLLLITFIFAGCGGSSSDSTSDSPSNGADMTALRNIGVEESKLLVLKTLPFKHLRFKFNYFISTCIFSFI